MPFCRVARSSNCTFEWVRSGRLEQRTKFCCVRTVSECVVPRFPDQLQCNALSGSLMKQMDGRRSGYICTSTDFDGLEGRSLDVHVLLSVRGSTQTRAFSVNRRLSAHFGSESLRSGRFECSQILWTQDRRCPVDCRPYCGPYISAFWLGDAEVS